MASSDAFKQTRACCTVPAVQSGLSYQPRGEYFECVDTKIYATGPLDSSQYGILMIYDIFGISPQIVEGADLLSNAASTAAAASDISSDEAASKPSGRRQYAVFMPDFFDGQPASLNIYPDDTPEKKAALEAFINGPGETRKTVARLRRVQAALQARHPQIRIWGLVGYCWGGWVASYATGGGEGDVTFAAAAQLHPGFVDEETAGKIAVPTLALCSEEEYQDEWRPFARGIRVEHRVEMFPDMLHGWMSARADLEDAKVRDAFGRGYQMVLDWFERHLDAQ